MATYISPKPRIAAAILLLLVSPLLSCLDGSSAGPDDDEIVEVVVEPSLAIIDVDEAVQLTATVFDGAGRVVQAQVVWTTSAPAVALVDDDGLVRGVSPGLARVSATAAGKVGISEITVRFLGSL
jgi:hypothetical protein